MIRFLNKGGSGANTSDATATADDILSPKTAYVNNEKIEGKILPSYITKNEPLNLSIDGYIGYTITNDSLFLLYTTVSGINIVNIHDGTVKFIGYSSMNIPEDSYSQIAVTSTNKNNERYISISTNKVNDLIYYVLINFNTFEIKSTSNISLGLSQGRYAYKSLGNSNKNSNLLYVSGLCNNQDSFVSIVNLNQRTYKNRISGQWFSNIMIGINDNFVLVNFTQDMFWIDSDGNIYNDSGTTFKNYILNTESNLALNTSDGNVYKYNEDFDSKKLNLGELVFNIKSLWNLPTGLSSSAKVESAFLTENIIFLQGYGFYKNGEKMSIDIDKNSILNKNICKNNIEIISITSNIISLYMRSGFSQLIGLKRGLKTYLDTSDTTASTSDILIEKNAYISGKKQTGTMPNNGELNYEPTSEIQSIPAGYTTGGKIAAMDITKSVEYSQALEQTKLILGDTLSYDLYNQITLSVNQTWNQGKGVTQLDVTNDRYYCITLTLNSDNLSNIDINGARIINDITWNNYWSESTAYIRVLLVKTTSDSITFSSTVYPVLQEIKLGGAN